ncbi:unnamed protein product [Mycena citricolor]|uniref:Heme haloperoxidase family profile domain-containing protein n=1 Tax=Mycena citricolor TaxID=2018698 RepID=A0AAD2H320_9AGAR|nr:unnamed protein product [Mycena citricolor]
MSSSTETLPASHPPVDAGNGKCPVTGQEYEFIPPQEGDIRSVCPAINAMANHGYIPRDGKNISPWQMIHGLKACYGLSSPLAIFLTTGGWVLLRKYLPVRINLFELGAHGRVEHDASVVHEDCPPDQKDAPIKVHPELVNAFATHVVQSAAIKVGRGVETMAETEVVVTGDDIVQTRLRREKLSPPLDPLHAEIARGEMAIILGVWEQTVEGRKGVPLPWMRRWLGEERLPDGWKPDHVQGLLDVVKRSTAMRNEMNRIREEEAKNAKDR